MVTLRERERNMVLQLLLTSGVLLTRIWAQPHSTGGHIGLGPAEHIGIGPASAHETHVDIHAAQHGGFGEPLGQAFAPGGAAMQEHVSHTDAHLNQPGSFGEPLGQAFIPGGALVQEHASHADVHLNQPGSFGEPLGQAFGAGDPGVHTNQPGSFGEAMGKACVHAKQWTSHIDQPGEHDNFLSEAIEHIVPLGADAALCTEKQLPIDLVNHGKPVLHEHVSKVDVHISKTDTFGESVGKAVVPVGSPVIQEHASHTKVHSSQSSSIGEPLGQAFLPDGPLVQSHASHTEVHSSQAGSFGEPLGQAFVHGGSPVVQKHASHTDVHSSQTGLLGEPLGQALVPGDPFIQEHGSHTDLHPIQQSPFGEPLGQAFVPGGSSVIQDVSHSDVHTNQPGAFGEAMGKAFIHAKQWTSHIDQPGQHNNFLSEAVEHIVPVGTDRFLGQDIHSHGGPLPVEKQVVSTNVEHKTHVEHTVLEHAPPVDVHGSRKDSFGKPIGKAFVHEKKSNFHFDLPGVHGNTKKVPIRHVVNDHSAAGLVDPHSQTGVHTDVHLGSSLGSHISVLPEKHNIVKSGRNVHISPELVAEKSKIDRHAFMSNLVKGYGRSRKQHSGGLEKAIGLANTQTILDHGVHHQGNNGELLGAAVIPGSMVIGDQIPGHIPTWNPSRVHGGNDQLLRVEHHGIGQNHLLGAGNVGIGGPLGKPLVHTDKVLEGSAVPEPIISHNMHVSDATLHGLGPPVAPEDVIHVQTAVAHPEPLDVVSSHVVIPEPEPGFVKPGKPLGRGTFMAGLVNSYKRRKSKSKSKKQRKRQRKQQRQQRKLGIIGGVAALPEPSVFHGGAHSEMVLPEPTTHIHGGSQIDIGLPEPAGIHGGLHSGIGFPEPTSIIVDSHSNVALPEPKRNLHLSGHGMPIHEPAGIHGGLHSGIGLPEPTSIIVDSHSNVALPEPNGNLHLSGHGMAIHAPAGHASAEIVHTSRVSLGRPLDHRHGLGGMVGVVPEPHIASVHAGFPEPEPFPEPTRKQIKKAKKQKKKAKRRRKSRIMNRRRMNARRPFFGSRNRGNMYSAMRRIRGGRRRLAG